MKQEMELPEHSSGSLFGGWLGRYQHVERMGKDEVEGLLLHGEVLVQTKLDGANMTVAWDSDRGLIIASRNKVVSVGGDPPTGFGGAVEWILGSGLPAFCKEDGRIVRGEWLVRHSVAYATERYKQFYVFDVEDRRGEFFYPDEYRSELDQLRIPYIQDICRLINPSLEDLIPYSQGPDEFGAQQKEGVVIKQYGFKNQWGNTVWGKIVSADFKEKNKLFFGAGKKTIQQEGPELLFVSRAVTPELVMKIIHKIKDARGSVDVKNMKEVLERAYYDAFTEELWEFVKNHRIGPMNFKETRRLCDHKAREIALAYFNGVPLAGESS